MSFRTGRGSNGHGVALFASAASTSATQLVLTTAPGTGGASPYTVSPTPVVTAKSGAGVTDTSFVGTVTVTLNVLTGSPVLSGTTTKTAVAGVADFSANGLTVTGAGTWTLTFSSGSLSPATSATGTTTTSNSAPNQPTISAGTPTSSGVTLTGSAFSDPDVGDTHAASQWQVTTSADTGYAATVISTGDDATNKTSYAATGLTASTAYIARVRYKDSAGNYSSWSTNASFTTAAASSALFRDDFTGTDGTLVQSHTPTWGGGAGVGTGWTRIGTVNGAIQTNRAYGGVGSNAQYATSPALGTNDYAATWVVRLMSTSSLSFELWSRMSSDGLNGYRLICNPSTGVWQLRRTVGGASQLVTGSPADFTDTWTVGTDRTVVFTVTGSSIAITIDGTTRFTATDTTIPSGQYVGWVNASGSASGIHVDSVSVQ